MISRVSVSDIVENLKDKPFLLYYLYNKYLTGVDTRLPKFINRKKVILDLLHLKLIDFTTAGKKSMHFKDTKFTNLGNEVYEKLDSIGLFTIFQNISLYSKDSFTAQYESKLCILEESIRYPQSIYYKIILKSIGDLKKWKRHGNVDYRVLEIKLRTKNEEFEILEILFEFNCKICQKKIKQLEVLTYFIDNDDNLTFQIKCNECNTPYRICKKFQCFYFI
ncbi:hypothetical protein LCGC14_0943890 [marine sediment metagenome]|uniref:Uncharacterized protein n=1 Tax=marine sediment metagenome TaxID=412755 RepID=A0A0F9R2U3_9ZZZZ|nr:MAG: hypothetical protein Lokiarch_48390 [Candidatus Lokiarchaeum sp. GC14_75]